MPKLLLTASTYSHIAHFHLPYLRRFRELGWEVHVGAGGEPVPIAEADVVLPLAFRKSMGSPDNFRAAAALRDLVRVQRYDLILTHTSLAAFFTRLAVRGMRPRPPLINMAHGYLFDDKTPALKRTVLLTAERLTAPQTDLLLTMNRWDQSAAERYRLGARSAMVPGIGVDFSRFDMAQPPVLQLRWERGIPADAFVLLYAAEFSKRKSQPVLLHALRQLPQSVYLALPGGGAARDECRTLAETLGVAERVCFPGEQADMAPWYALADAAVTASRSEGLPFNVMEAMYAGLPVVASRVKGHTDLLRHGETGLLYPYGDSEACAEQVRQLLYSEPLRRQLSAAAQEEVQRYRLERVLPVVMDWYLSVVPQFVPQLQPL